MYIMFLLVYEVSFDVRKSPPKPFGHEGVEDGVEDRVEVVKDTWRISSRCRVWKLIKRLFRQTYVMLSFEDQPHLRW